jgi:hypothetical protein
MRAVAKQKAQNPSRDLTEMPTDHMRNSALAQYATVKCRGQLFRDAPYPDLGGQPKSRIVVSHDIARRADQRRT